MDPEFGEVENSVGVAVDGDSLVGTLVLEFTRGNQWNLNHDDLPGRQDRFRLFDIVLAAGDVTRDGGTFSGPASWTSTYDPGTCADLDPSRAKDRARRPRP